MFKEQCIISLYISLYLHSYQNICIWLYSCSTIHRVAPAQDCPWQGSRKWDPLDPVGSNKTYFVRQTEIPTHGRLDTTHSRLDKLPADWKTVHQMVQTVLKIGQNITQSIILSILMGNLFNIADGCTIFKRFSPKINNVYKFLKKTFLPIGQNMFGRTKGDVFYVLYFV